MKFTTAVKVNEKHVDRMQHANHAEIARFAEQGRVSWLKTCGLYSDSSDDSGLSFYGSVVVRIEYNYRRECLLGEELCIVTQPEHLGHKSYRIFHEIIKPDGSIALDGRVTSVIMDLRTRTIIRVPDSIARCFPYA